jgi:hypothetical protein
MAVLDQFHCTKVIQILGMFTMSVKACVIAALAAVAVAKPIPDPLHVIRQSGPAAGQVQP